MDKIIDMTEEIFEPEPATERDELSGQLSSMTEKMNEKLELGRNSLIDMLKVTCDKFKTVNGTNHIYQMMLDAKMDKTTYDIYELIEIANNIAHQFAYQFNDIVENINDENSIDDIQKIFMERFYEPEYKYEDLFGFIRQLVAIQMVREIDGTCNDLLEFKKVAEEEIAKVQQKIDELENAD